MERLKVFIVREYWITDTSYRLHVDDGILKIQSYFMVD